MLCKNPYMKGVMPFGCGQCNPCRINKRRNWASAILLESMKHSENCFVTLTYKDDSLPLYTAPDGAPEKGTLCIEDYQTFFKQLRKDFKFRYFICGEYGDRTWRPHYHAALFGVSPLLEETIQRKWKKGFCQVGELNEASANYISGYVLKKLTSHHHPDLNGRYPEFARMSLKPGIGGLAVDDIADTLTTEYGADEISLTGDVPLSLKNGRRSIPLRRYLRRKLREKLGFKETGCPKEILTAYQMQMHELLETNLKDEGFTEDSKQLLFKVQGKSEAMKAVLINENKQKVLNLEARSKLYQKGKTL